jgi:hypothetical protein
MSDTIIWCDIPVKDLDRAGFLMGKMQPIKSWRVAIPAVKWVAKGQIGLNCVTTACERMGFANFRGWISKNPVKPSPAKSGKVRQSPTKEIVWISPERFKAMKMEACNS